MERESKFKIGDRVVATKTFADITAGNGYTVAEVDHSDDDMPIRVVDDAGDRCWLYSDQFRILTPALTIEPGRHYRTRSGKPTGRVSKGDTGFEAVVDGKVRIFDAAGGAVHGGDDIVEEWVPRVGERVVVVKTANFHPAVSSETECVVDSVTGDAIWLNASTESAGVLCQVAYLSDLEPLPVAAPAQPAATLKIEAGRYYKTRDGRKVGPMRTSRMPNWPFEGGVIGEGYAWYKEDGKCPHIPEDDLIAEWQDTPAAPVGAQVDTLAEEYGPVVAASRPKFKVGDRVRSVEDGPTKGLVGQVIDFDGSVVPYLIRFDGFTEGHGAADNEWWLLASEVDVPASTTAIVALIEDGQPKPADRPYVHTSEEAAKTEAKRLAGIHKGKQFGVFVLTTTAEEAKPAYRHEWQRLAADGQKIAAIKELRSLTGMMLKPAKDVVENFIDYPYGQAA